MKYGLKVFNQLNIHLSYTTMSIYITYFYVSYGLYHKSSRISGCMSSANGGLTLFVVAAFDLSLDFLPMTKLSWLPWLNWAL